MPPPSSPPRDLVAAIARCRRGPGRAFPRSVKQDVIAFASHRRSAGVSVGRTARALGLPSSTLHKWVAGVEVTSLVPVVAVPESAPNPHAPTAVALSLECPGGFVVRGLNVDLAASLLRALS